MCAAENDRPLRPWNTHKCPCPVTQARVVQLGAAQRRQGCRGTVCRQRLRAQGTRRTELLIQRTDTLGFVDSCYPDKQPWPSWERLLRNEFDDIYCSVLKSPAVTLSVGGQTGPLQSSGQHRSRAALCRRAKGGMFMLFQPLGGYSCDGKARSPRKPAAAGYPADLADPAAFPAGSLRTKPDSLGKPRAACETGGAAGFPPPASHEATAPSALCTLSPASWRPAPRIHTLRPDAPWRAGRPRSENLPSPHGLQRGSSPLPGPALLNAASVLPLGSKTWLL